MGTNYYMKYNLCDKCGRFDKIHLGKASAGWRFMLQYNEGKYYKNWQEMKEWLKKMIDDGAVIKNEYGEEVSLDEFINIVESKKNEAVDEYYTFIDEEGYRFDDEEFC